MGTVCKQRRMGVGGVVDKKCRTDDYLQLPIVSQLFVQVKKKLSFSKVNSHNNLSFYNNYTFLKRIDQLPTGPEWICDVVTITGNIVDDNGVCIEDNVEVWRRDPVECVKQLIGNLAFKYYMSYIAEHVYLDNRGKLWIFDEMWTADWWWNMQVSLFICIYKDWNLPYFIKKKLPEGATIAPLILSSDKTQLT